jgi:hypothetical protein
MIGTIAKLAQDALAISSKLAEHSDVIELALEALDKGASKETIMDSIKLAMRKASDAEMRRELGAHGESEG